MSQIDLSTTAITTFLHALPKAVLDSAAPTHLPISLPLAFPTPLHQINFISTVHLTLALLARPEHSIYYAEEPSLSPREMALRGCLGLYVASESDWSQGNLLSSESWKAGILDEAKVCEFFGIKVMREKAHETMPGIVVGERWGPGSSLASDMVDVFKRNWRFKTRCLGEEVQTELEAIKEDGALQFAAAFCEKLVIADHDMKNPYGQSGLSEGTILPATPMRLLQDLAFLAESVPAVTTPRLSDLVNLSPLPLPIALLLYLGVYDLSDSQVPELEELRREVGTWWKNDCDLLKAASHARHPPAKPVKIIKISEKTYDLLERKSVEACREIWSHARYLAASGDEGWKKSLSMSDIARIGENLETVMESEGLGIRLVLA